ncbi:MAG TPA: type VI secretion system baseplate subunit TssF [Bryobacteraceae bacterium]|nr:type VI secretion system baseplate subunit TssF [Bryobacteraceae bacterium]
MRDELLSYYERELTFLRQMGAEFAEKYPKIAGRLLLEPDRCEDPHVERLVEAFAFLAARVHLKIDDEFPEISEALLGVLYPHYVRPIPSMTVVEFHLDPEQGKMTAAMEVPRNSTLYSRPVDGVPCKFRTCYPVTLWPVTVSEAQWKTPDRLEPALRAPDAAAVCRIELTCFQDVSFSRLEMDALRFYLSGESNLVHALYELLCNNCLRVVARDMTPGSRKSPLTLGSGCLRPVGFRDEDAMLPYPRRSFTGYRLLQEYFAFPEKFFFLELNDLKPLAGAGFGGKIELLLLVAPFERSERQQMLEAGVSARTFRPNASPVINLFPNTSEPILLDQTRYEYPVVPDARRRNALEIFSVDEVVSSNPQTQEVRRYEPFFSYRHAAAADGKQMFWNATRRPSGRINDEGTEIWLSLADLGGRPVHPDLDSLTVRCTCSNRDLPAKLPFGRERGDFELEGAAAIKRIVALRKPTPTSRPPLGKELLWRLISQMSLNYLSLVEEGREALQEILRLYNFSDSTHLEKQIAGITEVKSRKHFARVVSENGISFARGTRVEMRIDEEQFVGGGVYLFAAVLEYFLGLYASMNSFSQLVVRTPQRKEALRQWPPRAGHAILL